MLLFDKRSSNELQDEVLKNVRLMCTFPQTRRFKTNFLPGLANLLVKPIQVEQHVTRSAYKLIDQFQQDIVEIQSIIFNLIWLFLF
jgi:hypothetical protein